jgi:hypothetical protein
MRCDDVMRELALGRTELAAEAQAHLRQCPACAEVVAAVGAARTESPTPDSARAAIAGIQANLRPVRPLRPAWVYLLILVAGVCLMAGAAMLLTSSPLAGLRALGAGRATAILGLVAAAAVVMAYCSALFMTPGSRFGISPRLALLLVGIAIPGLVVVLIPATPHPGFAHTAGNCFRLGLPYGLTAAMFCHLVIRTGAPLMRGMAGLTAGMLGGAASLAFLELHCPLLDAGHVLAGHVSIPLFCGALCAWLARWSFQPAGSRARRR